MYSFLRGIKMFLERNKYYKTMEEEFGGPVLAYITGDKPNWGTQIAQDAIDIFIEQLEKIGPVSRLILFLYTRGGDTSVAWNIVNLLRMYSNELVVIVPHKAHSAGTIISLGADRIIMTKQATLSPIDPSLAAPLCPTDMNGQNQPVSVEAINGFIELARNEFNIKTDQMAMASVLNNLSEKVHPLVLGQAYRSRAQIKMLASRLLVRQLNGDKKKINKVTKFLCSESGSHDYTINRSEALKDLGLKIEKPTENQYSLIKGLYDDFSNELGLNDSSFPRLTVGTQYSVKRAFIESSFGGSDYYVSEGKVEILQSQNGAIQQQFTRFFDGWRHEKFPLDQISVISNKGEEVIYEKDDKFSI